MNRETHRTGSSAVNYGSVIEMTLRDGRVKIWQDAQFGLHTGDPRTFTSFDQVWDAFRAQLENVLKHIMIQCAVGRKIKPPVLRRPLCLHAARHGLGGLYGPATP